MPTISKMKTRLGDNSQDFIVQYELPLGDTLIPMNDHIGETIQMYYQNEIHCIACGRKTNKSFAQGHCFPCFRSLAACDLCIMKPETCHFAEGSCREPEWGLSHCFIPHFVYLANSSGLKVGITRGTQIPTRWMDQGATQALPIFKIANRLQSGLLEVIIKQHISDRTDWRKMLKGDAEPLDLVLIRDQLLETCASEINQVIDKQTEIQRPDTEITGQQIQVIDEQVIEIRYPVTTYPEKIKSLNFDKMPEISGELIGIKGQYLILDCGVLNIRKFTGYNLEVNFV